MLKALRARLKQGHRTMTYPAGAPPELPPRFRGRPQFDMSKCKALCGGCAKVCPTGAICTDPSPSLDLGKCIFCGACEKSCPLGAVKFTREHSLAARNRADLILDGKESILEEIGCHASASPAVGACAGMSAGEEHACANFTQRNSRRYGTQASAAMDAKLLKVFGKSLKLRQVSAGGCGACEADTNVLNTVGWDLGRFGISFVASPRHADGLLITGPVTKNMKLALEKTYAAMPAPKIVIAVGSCAISGGPYIDHDEQCNGADKVIPVDLYIPGCPPHPLTILDGLLKFIGAIQ